MKRSIILLLLLSWCAPVLAQQAAVVSQTDAAAPQTDSSCPAQYAAVILIRDGSRKGTHLCCVDQGGGAWKWQQCLVGAGSGTVTGPASTTDNAIVRWLGTDGTSIDQATSNTPVISDAGVMSFTGVGGLVVPPTSSSQEGRIAWDTATDTLTVGTGSTAKPFVSGAASSTVGSLAYYDDTTGKQLGYISQGPRVWTGSYTAYRQTGDLMIGPSNSQGIIQGSNIFTDDTDFAHAFIMGGGLSANDYLDWYIGKNIRYTNAAAGWQYKSKGDAMWTVWGECPLFRTGTIGDTITAPDLQAGACFFGQDDASLSTDQVIAHTTMRQYGKIALIPEHGAIMFDDDTTDTFETVIRAPQSDTADHDIFLPDLDGTIALVSQTSAGNSTPLTWNATPATCTGDANGGALTVNGSNEIVCSTDNGGGATPGETEILELAPWGWWAADDPNANGGTHSYTDGNEVTTWHDKSGNDRDGEDPITGWPGSGLNGGTWKDTGTQPNGMPYLLFDSLKLYDLPETSFNDFTVVTVTATAGNATTIGGDAPSQTAGQADAYLRTAFGNDGSKQSYWTYDEDGVTDPTVEIRPGFLQADLTLNDWKAHVYRRDGSTPTYEMDGERGYVTFSQGNQAKSATWRFLAGRRGNGDTFPVGSTQNIAEMLVFNKYLTDTELDVVYDYLRTKYDLADAAGRPGGNQWLVQYKSGDTSFDGVPYMIYNPTATPASNIMQVNLGANSTLQLPQGATPGATAEGVIQWDTDDHKIAVGDATNSLKFWPVDEAGSTDTFLCTATKTIDGQPDKIVCATDPGSFGGGSGDITDVGDCGGPACFNGSSGTTLTFEDAVADQTIAWNSGTSRFDISSDVQITRGHLYGGTDDWDFVIQSFSEDGTEASQEGIRFQYGPVTATEETTCPFAFVADWQGGDTSSVGQFCQDGWKLYDMTSNQNEIPITVARTPATCAANQGMTWNSVTETGSCQTLVRSFEGRDGTVVATSGDYTASEVTNVPAGDIASTDVQAAINELDTEKAPAGALLDTAMGGTPVVTNTLTMDYGNSDFLVTAEGGGEAGVIIRSTLTRDAEWDTSAEIRTNLDAGDSSYTGTGNMVFASTPQVDRPEFTQGYLWDSDDDGNPDAAYVGDWDGDGSYEQADIRAAIAALTDTGQKHIKLGPYTFTGDTDCPLASQALIELPTNTTLEGSGWATVIEGLGDGGTLNCPVVANQEYRVQTGFDTNVIVRDLAIDGNLPEASSNYQDLTRQGLALSRCNDCKAERLYIHHTRHSCMYASLSDGITTDGLLLDHCGGFSDTTGSLLPCHYLYANGVDIQNVVVTDNTMSRCALTGINNRNNTSSDRTKNVTYQNVSVIETGNNAQGTLPGCASFAGTLNATFTDVTCNGTGAFDINENASNQYYDEITTTTMGNKNMTIDGLRLFNTSGLSVGRKQENLVVRNVTIQGNSGASSPCINLFNPSRRSVYDGLLLSECGTNGIFISNASGALPDERMTMRNITIDGVDAVTRTDANYYYGIQTTAQQDGWILENVSITGTTHAAMRMDSAAVNSSTFSNLTLDGVLPLYKGQVTLAVGGNDLPTCDSTRKSHWYMATDGTTATDCTAGGGGGANRVKCICDGSSTWASYGTGTGRKGLEADFATTPNNSLVLNNILVRNWEDYGIWLRANTSMVSEIVADDEELYTVNRQDGALYIVSGTDTQVVRATCDASLNTGNPCVRRSTNNPEAKVYSDTTPPATCALGDYFYDTNGDGTTNCGGGPCTFAVCTATNTWDYLDRVSDGGTFTGTQNFTGATTTVATAPADDNDTSVASTAFVQTELTAYASDTATFTNKSLDGDGTGNAIMIPDTTSGIASATENIAIDESNFGQLSFYDTESTAVRYVNAEKEVCKTIESLVNADDDVPIYWFRRPVVIQSVACTYTGASDPDIDITDESGNIIFSWTTAGTACAASPTYSTGLSNNTIAAGEGLEIDVVTEPSTPSGVWTTICFTYTETVQ